MYFIFLEYENKSWFSLETKACCRMNMEYTPLLFETIAIKSERHFNYPIKDFLSVLNRKRKHFLHL